MMECLLIRIFLLFCLSLIVGCDSDDDVNVVASNNIPTNEIFATYQLTATGDGFVDVYTQLKRGGLNSDTYIDLTEVDSLWVSTGDQISTLQVDPNIFEGLIDAYDNFQKLTRNRATRTEDDLFFEIITLGLFGSSNQVEYGEPWYAGQIRENAEDNPYTIEFIRTSNTSSSNSTVQPPTGFVINSPQEGINYEPENDLLITWEPSIADGKIDIHITQSCIGNEELLESFNNQDDTGAFTIIGWTLTAIGNCSYRIQINRVQLGVLDSALGGGLITATQVRSVSLM